MNTRPVAMKQLMRDAPARCLITGTGADIRGRIGTSSVSVVHYTAMIKSEKVIHLELEAKMTIPVRIPVEKDYLDEEFDLEGAVERATTSIVSDVELLNVYGINPADRFRFTVKR